MAGKLRRGAAILLAALAANLDKSREWKFVPNRSIADEESWKKAFSSKEFCRALGALGIDAAVRFAKEFPKVSFGPGKLNLEEYARYRLYQTDAGALEDKQKFVSDGLYWKLVNRVCDVTYDALTNDKFISYQLLSGFGFRVPKTLAVVTTGHRLFPSVERIDGAEALRRFIEPKSRKLFFKKNTGFGSHGAFIVDGVEDGAIVTRPHGRIRAEDLMAEIGGDDYLIQEFLQIHPGLASITSAVPTVRLTNFLVGGEVCFPISIMKIPAGDNIADNFWREGNLLADLDPKTGEIVRVIRGAGLTTELLDVHPTSQVPLIGFRVPFWRELLEVNRACALAFAPLPFSSLDLTVGQDGPIIVEVNTGGNFDLPQLASGRGLLTTEFKTLFGIR